MNKILKSIFTKHFYEMGYNVVLPYLRAHGKSEHSHCTMGWLERLDVIDWINFIVVIFAFLFVDIFDKNILELWMSMSFRFFDKK